MRPIALAAVAALALGLTPSAGMAASFYVLRQTPDAWTVLERGAVETTPGGIMRAWSVTVQRSIIPGPVSQPGYVQTLSEYDCAREQTRWLRFNLYSRAGGKVMSQENAKPDWTTPARNTERGAALALLCGAEGGSDLPVVSAPTVGNLILGLFATWP